MSNTRRRETLAARFTVADPFYEWMAPALPRAELSPRVLWAASGHAGNLSLKGNASDAIAGVERRGMSEAA